MPPLRVLVVDDEPMVREMLGECLREDGYDVVCAGNFAEALAAPPCDIAVVDIILPGAVDGLGLAGRLRARGTAVVMISGDADALERLALRGQPGLAKPFRLGDLLEAVRHVVRFRGGKPRDARMRLVPAPLLGAD